MDFHILGTLEVVDGDRRLMLGGARQRTVLAHLVLQVGQVIPVDHLIDAVWDDAPPPAARSTLQGYVSHLRRALGDGLLVHRSGGYVLCAAPMDVDAHRFEELVGQAPALLAGDPDGARSQLAEALALWRGPALADLADRASLQPAIARLEELRAVAQEARVEAELAAGRHAEMVPVLESLVGELPLRERLWGHLVTALYRSGRQAEALQAYRRARTLLHDELGIEPSVDLRQLQQQVLAQDPALDVAGIPLRGFRLVERLGAGTFGQVHRAHQPAVGRDVAVKVIHRHLADDPVFVRSFEVEAQTIARLEHPHVVPLFDYWREPGGAFLVMRLLTGGSLRDRLHHGPLPLDAALTMLDQVGQALDAAHRQGVVHRDVHPGNVLFDTDGNAYLSDFGIAMDLEAVSAGFLRPAALPSFRAPEHGRERATPTEDVYGLAMVAREALGIGPSGGDRPDLPPRLVDVLTVATSPDPVDRPADVTSLLAAIRDTLRTGAPPGAAAPATPVRNPYKGLRPFREADAADFFGRDATVERLVGRVVDQLSGTRMLTVVGASGSGKSSVVRAGLVPALRDGAAPGSHDWFIVDMVPGGQPFDELADALVRIAPRRLPVGLATQLRSAPAALTEVVTDVLPEDARLLLVVDQFEELFTLVADTVDREAFVATLVHAVTQPQGRVHVVATVRADFFDGPLNDPLLGPVLQGHVEELVPLDVDELEAVIAGPAERAGLAIEPATVGRILSDVRGEPGVLPLLQFTLTELADDGGVLTAAGYDRLGGVVGALGRRADTVLAHLPPAGAAAARQLFLRLVSLGEGAPDTRRRVPRRELTTLGDDPADMAAAIDAFGSARLLTFDRDPDTREPTVEVAHEALLDRWEVLQGWIRDARGGLEVERRLAAATREWLAAGQDPAFLAGGSRLDAYTRLRQSGEIALTPDEQAFIRASDAERDRQQAHEAQRQHQVRTLQDRSRRRLRTIVVVALVAAVIASGLSVAALGQRARARDQARAATVRELGAAATSVLDTDPELGILLALEALDRAPNASNTVRFAAEQALHDALKESRLELRVPRVAGEVVWSPDQTRLAVAAADGPGTLHVLDATTGDVLRQWEAHPLPVVPGGVEWSPDGQWLATSSIDGTLRLWDPSDGTVVGEVRGPRGDDGEPVAAGGLSVAPDGASLAVTWPDAHRVWLVDADTAPGTVVDRLAMPPAPWFVDHAPDGTALAVSGRNSTVVIDLPSGAPRFTVEQATGLTFSPDGRWLAGDGRLFSATGELRNELWTGRAGAERPVSWSADGTRLVTSNGSDGTHVAFDIAAGAARPTLLSARESSRSVAWDSAMSPDGSRVASSHGAGADGVLRIWALEASSDAEIARLPTLLDYHGGMALSPGGDLVAAVGQDRRVWLWDTETWQPTHLTAVPAGRQEGPFVPGDPTMMWSELAWSPDGDRLAVMGTDLGAIVSPWHGHEGSAYTMVVAVDDDAVVSATWWSDLPYANVAWGPDGALAEGGRHVRVVRGEAEIAELDIGPARYPEGMAFSPAGDLLAIVAVPNDEEGVGTIQLWDWASERRRSFPDVAGWNLALSPDGQHMTVIGPAGVDPRVYDLDTGEVVAVYAGHTSPVQRVAYSPDGSRVATGDVFGEVHLWDARTGAHQLVLRHDGGWLHRLAFSPDGGRLYSTSGTDGMRVWALDPGELEAVARAEVTRDLADDECRDYLHLPACPDH
jgi:WD40 repeat protein/DNA-binding SARP family transcriptional activator